MKRTAEMVKQSLDDPDLPSKVVIDRARGAMRGRFDFESAGVPDLTPDQMGRVWDNVLDLVESGEMDGYDFLTLVRALEDLEGDHGLSKSQIKAIREWIDPEVRKVQARIDPGLQPLESTTVVPRARSGAPVRAAASPRALSREGQAALAGRPEPATPGAPEGIQQDIFGRPVEPAPSSPPGPRDLDAPAPGFTERRRAGSAKPTTPAVPPARSRGATTVEVRAEKRKKVVAPAGLDDATSKVVTTRINSKGRLVTETRGPSTKVKASIPPSSRVAKMTARVAQATKATFGDGAKSVLGDVDAFVRDQVGRAISDRTGGLLRVPKFRRQVAAELEARLGPLSRRTKRDIAVELDKMGMASADRVIDLTIEGPGGRSVNVGDLIAEVAGKHPTARAAFERDALEAAAREISQRAEHQRVNRIFEDEIAKPISPDADGHLPAIIAKAPGDMPGLNLSDYRKPSGEVAGFLGTKGKDVWVHKDLHQVLKWHSKALEAISSRAGIGARINRFFKKNFTSRNPATHVNNATGNAILHMAKRRTPTGLLDVARLGVEHERWRTNPKAFLSPDTAGLTPKEAAQRAAHNAWLADIFEAADDLGAFRANALEADIGIVANSLAADKAAALPGGRGSATVVQVAGKVLDAGYALGDDLWRMEDIVHAVKKMDRDFDDLGPGHYARFQLTPSKWVTVLRESDGGLSVDGRKLTDKDVVRLKAQAGLTHANDWLFDYADLPIFPKVIRHAPLLGMASPFFVWLFKATDVPGIKRGLLRSIFQDSPQITTNSPKILARQSRDAGLAAAKMASLVLASQAAMSDERLALPKELRQLFAYANGTYAVGMSRAVSGDFIDFRSFTSANPFEGSIKVLNLARDAFEGSGIEQVMWGELFNPDRPPSAGADEDAVLEARGHFFRRILKKSGWDDVLDLLGVAGHPLSGAAHDLDNALPFMKGRAFERAVHASITAALSGAAAAAVTGDNASARDRKRAAESVGVALPSANRARQMNDITYAGPRGKVRRGLIAKVVSRDKAEARRLVLDPMDLAIVHEKDPAKKEALEARFALAEASLDAWAADRKVQLEERLDAYIKAQGK